MELLTLSIIALGLTVVMFTSRERMLGPAAAVFWAILGGYAYTESTTAWGDWQFFLAFACLLGMTTFSLLAAYALREKMDTIADQEMEQGEGELIGETKKKARKDPVENEENSDMFGDDTEPEPSTRTRRLRERVTKRRTQVAKKGEFDF
jgi:hypothetical protein